MDQSVDTAETEAILSSAAGSDTENLVRRVIEASPTALILVGPTGSIELVNGQAERMFAYDRDEMVNLPLESLLPENLRSTHVGLRNNFLKSSSTRQMAAGQELRGRRKDGSVFSLEIGLNPLSLHGRPLVLAGIIDLTARKIAEAEDQRQLLELERSYADLEEFAHVASHDLKAPLRALGHLAEWITEDVAATASAETLENLKILKGRVMRLQMLLDGLLVYARVGHGQKPAEDVDMDELVGDIAALLGPAPGFSVVREGVLGHLRTHRMPIRKVLETLISNAIKHHDRTEGRVEIAMRLADGIAEFRVTDDGPGIAPRFHARIFVIFQTLAGRDEIQSSGIGLAIVKKSVEGHGGTIRVESAPPARGTSFVFTWQETAW
jgi:PAS domain S-box-containing protein